MLVAVVPALLLALSIALPARAEPRPVRLGVDVLMESRRDLLVGKRVGLVVNPASVDGDLVPTVDRLRSDPGIQVVQLYGPEHGISGSMANGRSDGRARDARTGIPVEGLSGRSWAPSAESLSRLDVLVFDLQDIGSRTYTYATTLGKAMQAARTAGVKVVVLDRPNPLGGIRFEGPVRSERYKSLIGWGPFPVTHGMTMGEIARFYNDELGIGCDLEVVPMEGWKRSMVWDDTGLTWVPTSPGIPHELNAYLYVATGMVGGSGANVNEGGGNSMPFELIGAPYIDGAELANELARFDLPGVRFRPIAWKPRVGQYAGKTVPGVQLILKDPKQFRPLRTALAILSTLNRLYPGKLQIKDANRFARVWGREHVLPALRAGRSVDEIEAMWAPDLEAFAARRARHLMYE